MHLDLTNKIGKYLIGSKKDAEGLRTVLRQHEYGFSKTVFDTTVHPIKAISHQDFLAVELK